MLQAVNHLQSAHKAYEESIAKATDGVKEYLTPYTVQITFRKAVLSHCLLAICYRYLGEHSLMHDTIDQAIEIDRSYIGNRTIRQIGYLKSIFVLPVILLAWTFSFALTIPMRVFGRQTDIAAIESSQLLKFKAAMNA